MSDPEARELVIIGYSGRVGEQWLAAISRDEGRAIYPDEANAQGDFAMVDSVVAAHKLQSEKAQLWAHTNDVIGDNARALLALADRVWMSPADVFSRSELLAMPEIAALRAGVEKESPPLDQTSTARSPMPPLSGEKAAAVHGVGSAAVGHEPARKKTGFWQKSANFVVD
jgi:hypothetical protein